MESVHVERVMSLDQKKRKKVIQFLETQNLSYEEPIDILYAGIEENEVVASGALSGNVIKMLAVSEKYRGSSLIGKMCSALMNESFQIGQDHLFIYTKPENITAFGYLGFYEVTKTDYVALLENKNDGIKEHFSELFGEENKAGQDKGAVVVNCNPFTLGHQYLIEEASKYVDHLYVFVLSEDRSSFPFSVRYDLVKKGVEHIRNVTVYPTGPYMVSQATFPSYFLGDDLDRVLIQTELDAKLFGSQISKLLNIKKRFLGDEPFNMVTAEYNKALKQVLSFHDVNVQIIKRKEFDNTPISASKVRHYLANDNLEALKSIVPQSTYSYLVSAQAQEIIENIKREYDSNKRV